MTKVLDSVAIETAYALGKSEAAIARELGIGRSTVHRRLVGQGVPLRDAVEASDLRRKRTVTLTEETRELIDGLLLGDASVGDHRNSEARLELTQRRTCADWVANVATRLESAGFDTRITDRGVRGLQLRTGKYATLTIERRRWYPDGIKAVPRDVRLTPLAISQWYWGDGCTGNNGYRMTFHTEGFQRAHVEFLGTRLLDLHGISSRLEMRRASPASQTRPLRSANQYILTVSTSQSRRRLTKLLAPFCFKCFAYKLETKN